MARLLERSWNTRWAAGEEQRSSPWLTTYATWLGALLIAGWSHLMYISSRMTDGSDDPWGLVALVTALVFLPWKKAGETVPTCFAWCFSGCHSPAAIRGFCFLARRAFAAGGRVGIGVERPFAPGGISSGCGRTPADVVTADGQSGFLSRLSAPLVGQSFECRSSQSHWTGSRGPRGGLAVG
jgi:hypothetical protein